MATTATHANVETPADPVVLHPVESAAVCGECRFHIPHATRPGGWCACDAADLRWQPVPAGAAPCSDFATWPEGSAAPAFIAAMRL